LKQALRDAKIEAKFATNDQYKSSNYFTKNSNEIIKTSNVIASNKRPELKINTDEIQNKMH